MSYFEVKSPKRGAALKLDAPFFVIGRGERIPIFHDDPSLSREHAAIVVRKDGVRVRDLGSKNGVILNGKTIGKYAEADVKPGDMLQVGATLLVLREGEPPLRKAAPAAETKSAAGHASLAAAPASAPVAQPAPAPSGSSPTKAEPVSVGASPTAAPAPAPAEAAKPDGTAAPAIAPAPGGPKTELADDDFVPPDQVEEILTTQESEAPGSVSDSATPPPGDETEDLSKTQDSTVLPAVDPSVKKDDKPLELA
ncbi:FHA domain-containing protein [bacterium]|nr:FHA domain-containing protein [bacterium]